MRFRKDVTDRQQTIEGAHGMDKEQIGMNATFEHVAPKEGTCSRELDKLILV